MRETIIKGTTGAAVTFLAALNPAKLETNLHNTSMILGSMVSVVTLISLIRRWNKK